jgi:hypothetical protein
MIYKEEEAKTKRCQESFAAARHIGNGNEMAMMVSHQSYAYTYQTAPTMCLGSGCMAWRWHKRTAGEAQSGAGRGYCGKAGRPD